MNETVTSSSLRLYADTTQYTSDVSPVILQYSLNQDMEKRSCLSGSTEIFFTVMVTRHKQWEVQLQLRSGILRYSNRCQRTYKDSWS